MVRQQFDRSQRAKARSKELGFTLTATAAGLFMLVGMLGLAADLGRVFIVKSEAQAFADIAAMAAAKELNGKSSGITNAQAQVANSTNKWMFGTKSFVSGIRTVEFATKSAGASGSGACTTGTWTTAPSSPYDNYGCVRVTVTPAVDLSFMPVLGTGYTQTVTAQAVAGVVPKTFPLGGYMPFTPFAHMPNCSVTITTGCDSTGNFGFLVGDEYGFHWPGNINSNPGGMTKACHGDQLNWPLYNFSDQVGGSVRGYFELQAASAIADAILGAEQTMPLAVGDQLTMTNGNKQAMADALTTRAGYDTDQTHYNWVDTGIAPAYNGNNMRKVVMPVNSGPYVSAAYPTPYTVLGFASFLLYPNYNVGSGNQTWCAIYMGSDTNGGSSGVFGIAGAYVVRLTQ